MNIYLIKIHVFVNSEVLNAFDIKYWMGNPHDPISPTSFWNFLLTQQRQKDIKESSWKEKI